jgi:hypothetical protein
MSTATVRFIFSNISTRIVKKLQHLKHGQVTRLVSQNAPYMSCIITVVTRLNLNAEAVRFMCYQSSLRRNDTNMVMKSVQ